MCPLVLRRSVPLRRLEPFGDIVDCQGLEVIASLFAEPTA